MPGNDTSDTTNTSSQKLHKLLGDTSAKEKRKTKNLSALLGEPVVNIHQPIVKKEEAPSVSALEESKAAAPGIDKTGHDDLWADVEQLAELSPETAASQAAVPSEEQTTPVVVLTDGRKKKSKLDRMLGTETGVETQAEKTRETKEAKETKAALPEAGDYTATMWYYPGGFRAAGVGGSYGHVAIELPPMAEQGVNAFKSQMYSSKYLTYGKGAGRVGYKAGEDIPEVFQSIATNQYDDELTYNTANDPTKKGIPIQLPPGGYYRIIEATEQFLERFKNDYELLTRSCVHSVLDFMQTMYGDQEPELVNKILALNTIGTTPAQVFLVIAQHQIARSRAEILFQAQTGLNARKAIVALIQNDIARLEVVEKGKGSPRTFKIAVLKELLDKCKDRKNSAEHMLYALDKAIQESGDKTKKHLMECQPILFHQLQKSYELQEVKKSDESLAREEVLNGYYQSYFSLDPVEPGLFYKDLPEKEKHRTLVLEINIAMIKYINGGKAYADGRELKEAIEKALKATKPGLLRGSKCHSHLLELKKLVAHGIVHVHQSEAKQTEIEFEAEAELPRTRTRARHQTMVLPEGWIDQSTFTTQPVSTAGSEPNPDPESAEAISPVVLHHTTTK